MFDQVTAAQVSGIPLLLSAVLHTATRIVAYDCCGWDVLPSSFLFARFSSVCPEASNVMRGTARRQPGELNRVPLIGGCSGTCTGIGLDLPVFGVFMHVIPLSIPFWQFCQKRVSTHQRMGARHVLTLLAKRWATCRSVFVIPCGICIVLCSMERLRCRSPAQTPWETFPSALVRVAWRSLNSRLCRRWRAIGMVSWWVWGRRVSRRRLVAAVRVQCTCRTGEALLYAELSTCLMVHVRLVFSSRQMAMRFYPLMTQWLLSTPCSLRPDE